MCRRGLRGSLAFIVFGMGILAATAARAQTGAIVGRVTDAKTGAPIAAAGVEEQKTGIWVSTDNDGNYRHEFPPGSYRLRVVGAFYEAKEIDVTVNQN